MKRFLLPCTRLERERPSVDRALESLGRRSSVSPIPPFLVECLKVVLAPADAPQSACVPRIPTQPAPAKIMLWIRCKEFGAAALRQQTAFAGQSSSGPCEAGRELDARSQGLRGSGMSFSRAVRIQDWEESVDFFGSRAALRSSIQLAASPSFSDTSRKN